MAQPWESKTDFLENVRHAITILNVGAMNDSGDEKTLSVGEDMTLAFFDLLARCRGMTGPSLRRS